MLRLTYLKPTGKDDTNRLSDKSAKSNVSGSTDAKKKPGTGPLSEFVETKEFITQSKRQLTQCFEYMNTTTHDSQSTRFSFGDSENSLNGPSNPLL